MPRLASAIFDLASEHDGVFTAMEASGAGVSHEALAMATRRGTIIRLSRGIYRLVAYPSNEERVQFWEAVLWPTMRRGSISERGVLSHLTALALSDPLLEYTPAKIAITVPERLRVRRSIPPWLELFHANLKVDDLTSTMGLPMTTIERTLRDCIGIGVERRFVIRALDNAHNSGVMAPAAIAGLRKLLG